MLWLAFYIFLMIHFNKLKYLFSLIFSFMVNTFCVLFKFLTVKSWRYSTLLSSISFVLLQFTFWSIITWNLFLCMVRGRSQDSNFLYWYPIDPIPFVKGEKSPLPLGCNTINTWVCFWTWLCLTALSVNLVTCHLFLIYRSFILIV